MRQRCVIAVEGIVQGVGFRPFVHGLAVERNLAGRVWNDTQGVRIELEGESAQIDGFLRELRHRPPPLAQISDLRSEFSKAVGTKSFVIDSSREGERRAPQIAADAATCSECLRELFDPADRRYLYPFLNCTHCGPRMTIVQDVPYDRSKTTMAGFPMCGACRAEYEDPADRRFHAQPTACPECGPRLSIRGSSWEEMDGDPLDRTLRALREGRIVAVKGLGGYHLACDAENEEGVARLRMRKRREAKPFAIMVTDLDVAGALCRLGQVERQSLSSPRRPIMLLKRRDGCRIAPSVAPGQRELGLMLPYTPLHHLLARGFGSPMVMTSGNRSDQPTLADDDEAREELSGVADLFLTHDRPIEIRCDDSVTRITRGVEVPLRRSRGFAPQPLTLPFEAKRPILATGGDLKACFGLVQGRHAFLSHHIGDLAELSTYRDFGKAVAHYQRLFGIEPEIVAHDMHPGYHSTDFAESLDGVGRIAVQHHHAHIAACMADNGVAGPVIGVAFDGTGYGLDGSIWGGEFLVADYSAFERIGYLRPVLLPGGDRAVRQPWRSAAAHLHTASLLEAGEELFAGRVAGAEWRLVAQMLQRKVGCVETSSMGRLFDAVAALLGLADEALFEAQAAMALEAAADERENGSSRIRVIEQNGAILWDARTIIKSVLEDRRHGDATPLIAARFHNSIAEAIVTVCRLARRRHDIGTIALSGGTFQNAMLADRTAERLSEDGFSVLLHRQVPCNDGGLCLGQAAVAAHALTED